MFPVSSCSTAHYATSATKSRGALSLEESQDASYRISDGNPPDPAPELPATTSQLPRRAHLACGSEHTLPSLAVFCKNTQAVERPLLPASISRSFSCFTSSFFISGFLALLGHRPPIRRRRAPPARPRGPWAFLTGPQSGGGGMSIAWHSLAVPDIRRDSGSAAVRWGLCSSAAWRSRTLRTGSVCLGGRLLFVFPACCC